jgi:hypothetical protein
LSTNAEISQFSETPNGLLIDSKVKELDLNNSQLCAEQFEEDLEEILLQPFEKTIGCIIVAED